MWDVCVSIAVINMNERRTDLFLERRKSIMMRLSKDGEPTGNNDDI
jgi:hypothetical protein